MHLPLALVLTATALHAADPTFLRRHIPDIPPAADDLTAGAKGAAYRPAFGAGDPQAKQLKSIARYGELTLDPGGETALVSYPAEEQIYFVLSGNATVLCDNEKTPVKHNDFLYVPANSKHGLTNPTSSPAKILIMGFRLPKTPTVPPSPKLMLANANDVPLIELASHGPTTKFKLLMGTTQSTRDKLPAASTMVSLFIMDFAPGGTNIPHHHESEEEIYYVLKGRGDMVAGGGADGNEGRYPSTQGDAFFLRLNTTVGFYSAAQTGDHDQVLAVRSTFPFPPARRP